MILYHYTSRFHLPRIEASGYLKTVESNLHPSIPRHGPDVVWLLDTPDLMTEEAHGLSTTPQKTEVRFTVDVPEKWVRPWVEWSSAQLIDPVWQEIMIVTGGGEEAAAHWMVTFRTIPRKFWVNITVNEEVLV